MTRVSVIPVERALSVTPTPSVACSTVTAHPVMLAARATSTETNAALVRKDATSVRIVPNMHFALFSFQSFSSSPSGTNPCEHGGLCVNTDGSFTCNCVRGYAGPRCEQDVNECASSPCQNDGTCLDRIGDYTCICMPGILLEKFYITFHFNKF